MQTASARSLARTRLVRPLAAAMVAMLTVGSVGCQDAASPLPAAQIAPQKAATPLGPAELLAAVAKNYHSAKTYEDAGTLKIAVENEAGEKQESPAMPFSVAFQRPNEIRVHSLQASIVGNGKQLFATSDALEGQVLVQSDPPQLTSEVLFADELLAETARAQLDVALPQLALLLDDGAIEKLTDGGKPTALPDAELEGVKCRRVAVKGRAGTSVFWISSKNLLLKFEFPSDELKQKFSVAKCTLWADFKGASINDPIKPEAFTFEVPKGAQLLSRLFPPPPGAPSPLLGQTPDDFTFVDVKGKPVSRESLKDKIAVLDLWATWCGWCFEGFPNLQKVYDEFKNNDKVVILAVNQDDPSVSDEKVRQSFAKAKLTIPIVRDSRQDATKSLHVEGLPTMVILGPDGTIEDYHVGYDAQLSETLPAKLKRLIAGESLAKDELAKFEAERKKYDEELAAAQVKIDE